MTKQAKIFTMGCALAVGAWGVVAAPAVAAEKPAAAAVASAATAETAKATLADRSGKGVGTATLEDTPNGVLITLELSGLPPGPHAFHIHGVGKCEAPFSSAGDHFNPEGREHGFESAKGAHAGDLPNVFVDEAGRGKAQVLARDATLRPGPHSLFDADGSSLVVHANADDFHSAPAGNAGDRIACGVVAR